LSNILEAVKQAELASSKRSDADAGGQPERRRTPRLRVQIPVLVYGYKSKKRFHDDARTLEVNADGGLLSLHTAPRVRQKLLLVNKKTRIRTIASFSP
jgi:hypothetical protein